MSERGERCLLAKLKRFLCRFFCLIEFCHTCGRRQDLLWWAPDELWLELVGTTSGVRCVRCFDQQARARGISLRWRPEVEWRRKAA